ncbi:MAG: DUF3592 domain-containing protein [Woeseiaceae bacterium]|nr:DUF3592 domain-containing protein [Woeseiaceae bacterium]
MKARIFVSLFALPFAAVGVWMAWSVGSTLVSAWQMKDWVPVEARLQSGGYQKNSDTYEAFAEYSYAWQGRDYRGNRVSIASGSDNIGDFQEDLGRRLLTAWNSGQPITVFVNPEDPARSIVDRDVRWGLVGFKMIFVIVFGGVGFGLLYAAFSAAPEKDTADSALTDEPWLLNDDWQTSEIRSGSKSAMWGAWVFALLWNAISSFVPFAIVGELENGNYIALVGLLFPLVGVGLLFWAIRRTLEWRRFGPSPVLLDPFPGSIGGHVGGTIDLNLPFDPKIDFKLTLTNINSYMSGSGDDRSRREKARWQDAIIAHAEPGSRGTRLTFRFEVPDDLQASDAKQDDNYMLWRLNLAADLPGTDLDRDYELPVYPTAQESRFLKGYALEKAKAAQSTFDTGEVRRLVNLSHETTGKRLLFPMGRFFAGPLGGIVIGAVFVGSGWFLIAHEDAHIFGGIFCSIGALLALAFFYVMFNSLEVRQTPSGLKTIRRVLGIPVRSTELVRSNIASLMKESTMQSQSGNKHTVFYNVYAVDRSGGQHVLGDGFKGESQANAALELIALEFGLPLGEEDPLGPEVAPLQ